MNVAYNLSNARLMGFIEYGPVHDADDRCKEGHNESAAPH